MDEQQTIFFFGEKIHERILQVQGWAELEKTYKNGYIDALLYVNEHLFGLKED